MARSHVRLQFGAWRKPGHSDVSKDARWLYVTILCDETLNQAGVVRVALEVWADDAGMTADETRAALDELEKRQFVVIDRHELLIRTFVRNDGVSDQPNVLRNALEVAHHIRSPLLRTALADELRKLPPPLPDKLNEKTGRTFVYPDPHACADELDPDGAPPPCREYQPSNHPQPPVDNSSENPSPNPSAGTLPGTLPGTPRGSGRGRGRGTPSADSYVGGSRTHARETPTPHDPPCEKPCHVCASARLAAQADAEAAAAAERERRAEAARLALDCDACDDHEWLLGDDRTPVEPARRCQHRPLRSVS